MTAWRPLPLIVGRPVLLLAGAPVLAMKEFPALNVVGAAPPGAVLGDASGATSCISLRARSSTSSWNCLPCATAPLQ